MLSVEGPFKMNINTMVKIKVCILNSEHNIAIQFKSVCVCVFRESS